MRPDLQATSVLRFSASVVRLAGCDPLQMLRTISGARDASFFQRISGVDEVSELLRVDGFFSRPC
jgi:hypothetical protein